MIDTGSSNFVNPFVIAELERPFAMVVVELVAMVEVVTVAVVG